LSSYSDSYSPTYVSRQKRKHGKALKIVLSILILIIVILGILFAINYNTIMMFFGKGNLKVKDISQIKSGILSTGEFTDLKESVDANGSSVLTGVSKDKAVTLTITQSKSGAKTVSAKVDTSKLDTSGINKDALLKGQPAAVQSAKSLADKYIGTVVDSSDVNGMEAYLAGDVLSKYKSDPSNLTVDHNFGDTNLNISGDSSTGILNINLKQ
jgi:hypothetical protein